MLVSVAGSSGADQRGAEEPHHDHEESQPASQADNHGAAGRREPWGRSRCRRDRQCRHRFDHHDEPARQCTSPRWHRTAWPSASRRSRSGDHDPRTRGNLVDRDRPGQGHGCCRSESAGGHCRSRRDGLVRHLTLRSPHEEDRWQRCHRAPRLVIHRDEHN